MHKKKEKSYTIPTIVWIVDGATFGVDMSVGVEVVIRDCAGYVTAALSKKLHYPLGPLESKVMVMEGAWDVSVYDVVFECDSKIVFDSLNGSN